MFHNPKIYFDADIHMHVLSFDTPSQEFFDRLWQLADERKLQLRTLNHAYLWDGEEGKWLSISADKGSIWGTTDAERRFHIGLHPRYDDLDGTLDQPPEDEHLWMRFVPICVDLLKLTSHP